MDNFSLNDVVIILQKCLLGGVYFCPPVSMIHGHGAAMMGTVRPPSHIHLTRDFRYQVLSIL